MRSARSHEWLGFSRIAAWVLVPAFMSVAGGIWLAYQAACLGVERDEKQEAQEVSLRSRTLVDGFRDSLEVLRLRALAAQLNPPSIPFEGGPILYWAELEVDAELNVLSIRHELRNGDFDLQRKVLQMKLQGLAADGVALLPIHFDEPGHAESVALVFPTGQAGTAVLAVVDPAEAFPVFKRWSSRSEAGLFRAYWVSPEGKVLAHSVKSLQGADFRGLPVFEGAVKELLKGTRMGGIGKYVAIDHLGTLTGYARPGKLPLALVVEKVEAPAAPWLAFRKMTEGLELGWLALTWVSLCLSLLIAWILKRSMTAATRSQATEVQQPAVATRAELQIDLDQEMPSPVAEAPAGVLRFENSEFARIAASFGQVPDSDPSQTIARQLTEMASRICGSPAFFFAHHPKVHSAILEATSLRASNDSDESDDSVDAAFPILEGLKKDLARQEARGILPLRDYLPLTQTMERYFQTTDYQAWIITGLAEGSARFLGILVILKPETLQPEEHDSMIQLIRGTAPVYEESLSGR